MKRKKVKCPKCNSTPAFLVEYWRNHYIYFETDKKTGLWDGKDGICNPGEPDSVWGVCDCGKKWKLRNIKQIIEIEHENNKD